MGTTPNIKVKLEPVVDRKSVHFPSAKSLALLRSQVSSDENIVETSDSNTDDATDNRNAAEIQKSLHVKIFDVVSFSMRFPGKFIQTRPWLSGVSAMCVVLVYLVVILPGQNQNDDGLDSLDFDVVTRYPDRTKQTVANDPSYQDNHNPVLPVSGELTADTAQKINTPRDNDNKAVVDKNSSSQPWTAVMKNIYEERAIASHTQDGAWLTGKIEIVEGATIPQSVRKKTEQKKHRIVLRPLIRK